MSDKRRAISIARRRAARKINTDRKSMSEDHRNYSRAAGKSSEDDKSMSDVQIPHVAQERGAKCHKIMMCALCLGDFTSPRLLPCFHTFCLGCLKQLVTAQQLSNSFLCPSCRTTITIPPGGVEKFQVNFYLEAEKESQQVSSSAIARPCDVCCKDVPITHKCTNCNQFTCQTCTAIHASIEATKSHTVLSLKDTKDSGVKVIKEKFCTTHKQEKIRFFCKQCSTVICRDCKLTRHESHATVDLCESVEQANTLMKKVMNCSQEGLEPKLRQVLEEAKKHKDSLQDKKKTILDTMEHRAQELKQKIDESLSEAKEKLNQDTNDVEKIVTKCISDMTAELACFVSVKEHAEILMEKGCDADVLEMMSQLQRFFETNNTVPSGDVLRNRSQQTPSVSPCGKFKSFTTNEWTLNLDLDCGENRKPCRCCSVQYDQARNKFCPTCRSPTPSNQGTTGLSSQSFIQCAQCFQSYQQTYDSCPSCGATETSSNQDALRSVQKTLSQYIGWTGKSYQSWAKDNRSGNSYRPRQQQSDYMYGMSANSASAPEKREERLAREIETEVSSIQSLLCKWP